MTHTIQIDEGQRQLLLLALAQLSLDRPGWHRVALTELAKCVPGGLEMYERFREINGDEMTAAAERSHRNQLGNVAEVCAKIAETWLGCFDGENWVRIKDMAQEIRQYSADLKGTGENVRSWREDQE